MFLEIARQAAEETGVEEIFTIDPSDASPLTKLMGEPLAEQVEVSQMMLLFYLIRPEPPDSRKG